MTNVSNQVELEAAIAAQETNIVVTASFEIERQITIFYQHTISGDDNGPYTLKKRQDFNLSVFNIINRGELTLRNIILDGAKDTHSEDPASESLVIVTGGALLLDTGSVLQNNYASTGGGVSLSAGGGATSNLFMQGNAVIRNNTAANGGGISCKFGMTGNVVEIGGNAVIENNVASDGGGINFNSTVDNTLYIKDDVKITGNTATANGGGINASNSSVFLAGSVEVSGNTAANGGGVALSGSGITVEDGVTIGNNTATRKGGGVYINSSESTVSVSGLIQDNTSPKTGGVFIENTAQGSLDFSHARFVRNTSSGAEGDGGGLNYFRETGEPSTLAITLNSTVFDGNRSGRNGGGMCIECYVSSTINLSVDGCRLENNVATNVGGGMNISLANSTILVQDSTLSNNNASAGGGCAVLQIFSGQSTVTFQNVIISENRVTSNAGGIFLGGENQEVTLSGVTMEKNNAGGLGGAIESSYGSGTLTINNYSKFLSNHAGIEGGGIYIYNSKIVTLENVDFAQNTARNGNDFFLAGELRIGSSVYLLSGILIENAAYVPAIFQSLSTGSAIQLEQSYYVYPSSSGTPIVVASGDLTLSPQDAAAFRVPTTEGFAGWEIRLSDDNKEVLLMPADYIIAYENTKGAENPNPSSYTVVTPTVTLIDLPSTSAYRFLGWFDAPDGENRVTEIPQGSTGDRTLYAQWENIVPPHYFRVYYEPNVCCACKICCMPPAMTIREHHSARIPCCFPRHPYCCFVGWNTRADGSGTWYAPGQTISVSEDLSLFAQWK